MPAALRAVAKGGSVVCGGIHMSDIPALPYELLWGERMLRSVANLTRADGERFLELAPRVPVRTRVESYPLAAANEALEQLRAGRLRGAAVLVPSGGACRLGLERGAHRLGAELLEPGEQAACYGQRLAVVLADPLGGVYGYFTKRAMAAR